MNLYYYYWYDGDTAEFIGRTEKFLANDLIMDYLYLKLPNFKVYYWRYWTDERNVTWQDFGSWSKFFLETEQPIEQLWPEIRVTQ